ncbi:MAG: protein kinase [Chloroflexi bacterium]|nr:protein kinase [Chloroflexota bacterium]
MGLALGIAGWEVGFGVGIAAAYLLYMKSHPYNGMSWTGISMMDPYINRTIKGYELRGCVGAGGFGAVYRAYQPSVGREVAIKVILPERANQPEFIRRFEVEAQVIARLEHPYIVPIYDYWRDPEGAFLVMRWLRGSLRTAIKQGAWSPQSAARLLEQIAAALTVAHREGIIHRDIKPDNILLDEDDNAYLADFGIAKNLNAKEVTQEGMVIGSPTYITPEQIKGDPVSPKTDIYSLGLVVFELLRGEPPYAEATTPTDLISHHLNAPLPRLHPRDPQLPAALDEVLQTATAKNPDQRYANVLRFAAAFATSISGAAAITPLDETLTPRELDILRLMVEGLSNAQIAEKLFLSGGTVKWYVNQIYAKLDVHSRSQAVERANQLKLVQQEGASAPSERTVVSVLTPVSLPELSNPYKGLRAFQEADAADFFGRAALTEQLLGRMAASDDGARFLALVGPSGSGKSSAVRAGLIPALRKGALPNSAQWFITEMMPGTHPFEELEAALLCVAASYDHDLRAQLTEDRRGLVRAVKRLLPHDPQVELVLIIDQFEELFTLTTDELVRSQFIDSLLAAVSDPRSRMRIVLTLRADFYDRPLLYPRMAELMRSHTEVAVPLTASELERAIAGPAERIGLTLEPGLTTTIINDVFGQPAALPLLQFSLSELYERRKERLLTISVYQETGGISGALARRADELFGGLDTVGQSAARQIFLRLIAPGEGVEDTRRRVLQTELMSLADERTIDDLITFYSQYRLLTLDHDPITRGATVEIAHEALLHGWDRLRGWLEASRDELRLQRRLAVAAGEWVGSGRDVSFLASGARLIQFEALSANGSLSLNGTERAYLEASVAERERTVLAERERQAHELTLARESARAQQRAANRLRYLVGLMIVAVVMASILSVFAISRQQLADHNAALAYGSATEAAANAQRAQSLRLAAEANRLLQTGDSAELTALLAVRSLESGYSQQADSALQQAILLPLPERILTSDSGTIGSAFFLPDGTIFTTGDESNDAASIARLWDAQTGQVIRRFDEISARAAGAGNILLAHNGKSLIAFDAHTVWLYDLQTGMEIRHFTDNTRRANTADLSPDGKYLLRGDRDGTVRMFDVATGDEVRHFDGLANEAIRVLFSPDGKYVFTTPERTVAAVWDAQTGQQIARFVGHTDAVYPMGVSPNGKYLLTASNDSTARLWDMTSGQEVRRFVGHTGSVWTAAFSPDGAQILTGGIDRTARLWDAATGEELYRFTGTNGALYSVGFSPDGKSLIAGGDDLYARIWAVPTSESPRVLRGHTDDIRDVLVSPDGAYYVTASVDGTARIWDPRTGTVLNTLKSPSGANFGLLLSPGKKLLGTLTDSGAAYIWSFPDGALLQTVNNCCGTSAAISPDETRFVSSATDNNQPMLFMSDISDVNNPKQIYAVPVPTTGRTLQFSADGKTLLMSGEDQVARLFDAQTGAQIQQFVGHTGIVTSAAFSLDGSLVLTASEDKTARLWDIATGREIRRLVGHTAFLNDAAFSPDGRTIATASGDGTARLWDAHTGQELRVFIGHTDIVFSVTFTPDGAQLITGSRDRTARIWDVDYHRLIEAACQLLPRDLTTDERAQFDIDDTHPTCPSH